MSPVKIQTVQKCNRGGGGHNGQNRIYIKLNREIGNLSKGGYSELANTYTESYYMTDCGGYDDFKNSHGMEMTARLREVYSLTAPSRGDRILDIGCGRGELSFALAAAGAQVEGVDYSKDAIAIAKRTFEGKCETLRYTCADIFEMKNLGTFDKIIMADVVEHIEQEVLEKIFQKISQSLRKDGCLIIHTAPNRDYYEITYPELRQQARRLGVWKPRNPRSYYEQLMHINEQTPVELKSALSKYFRHVRVWTGGVRGIDEVKTQDESRLDMDIFAIACQDNGPLEAQLSSFIRRPEWDGCRVSIEAADIEISAGEREKMIGVTLLNEGTESLCSQRKYPINLSYHILDRSGDTLLFDGERTPIWEEIGPGVKRTMRLRLILPGELARRKDCVCRITLVAEGCFWFDREGGNKKDVVIHFNESKEEQ